MRIGINARLFVKGKMDGIAWYAYEMCKRMTQQHPDIEFVFFFDRKPDPYFLFSDNIQPVVVHPQARHPLLWYLFFEFGIKKALKKEKIDLFFSPDGWLCLHTDVKTINVIHDLNFEHFPNLTPPLWRRYYQYFFPRFAQKANLLATVSNYSREDIISKYDVDSQKVFVTHNAAADDFFEITQEEKAATKQRFSRSKDYFVFVGTVNKRKNINNILLSYDLYRQQGGTALLVFAGMQKYWDREMKATHKKMQFKDDIIFTGYISTADINRLIGSSIGLIYTSLFEGFGVPILEAFACATPVITSNISSMPEIAGNAAIKVSPLQIDEIAQAMLTLSNNQVLREDLIMKGKQRLNNFSWDKSQEILWEKIMTLYQSDKQ